MGGFRSALLLEVCHLFFYGVRLIQGSIPQLYSQRNPTLPLPLLPITLFHWPDRRPLLTLWCDSSPCCFKAASLLGIPSGPGACPDVYLVCPPNSCPSRKQLAITPRQPRNVFVLLNKKACIFVERGKHYFCKQILCSESLWIHPHSHKGGASAPRALRTACAAWCTACTV